MRNRYQSMLNSYQVEITFWGGGKFVSTHRAFTPEAAMHKAFDAFAPGSLATVRSIEIVEV